MSSSHDEWTYVEEFRTRSDPLFDDTAIPNRYYAIQQTDDTVLVQDELVPSAWIQSDEFVTIGGGQ